MSSALPYLGELAALLTTLSWSIGVFPFTEASRRMGPNEVNHFRLVLASVALTLLSILMYHQSVFTLFSRPTADQWLWLGLSGVIGLALGDHFGFTALAILGTRVATVFSTLAPGAALLFGYILLGEQLNLTGMLGMMITIGGVSWLTLGKYRKEKHIPLPHGKLERGIFFGILSALAQGIGLVLAKKGLAGTGEGIHGNPVHATWIRMAGATSVIWTLTIIRGKAEKVITPVLKNKNKGILPAAAGTFFGPVTGVCLSMYAITLVNVSVAQTIFSLVPVVVLPISYFLYKEKLTLQSVAAALIAIGGVFILIWRNNIQACF